MIAEIGASLDLRRKNSFKNVIDCKLKKDKAKASLE